MGFRPDGQAATGGLETRMNQGEHKTIFEERMPDLIAEHRGIYLLVNAVSRRVRALQQGDRAYVPVAENTKDLIKVAMREFADEKILVVRRSEIPDDQMDVDDDLPSADTDGFDAATAGDATVEDEDF